ncbi:hypothetical protein KC316_g2567 [Hortaea werneckii]|nr:hypothetical protein KC316_g2567 [Hortaea werneckii]
MYISVFPIAISVRRTNVYEEKSLGIWGGENEAPDENAPEQSFVGQHLRRQLSFDLWYVFLGFFIICIVEGGRLANTNEYAFTMFSVLFEIVSAYGTVGLSLGYPGFNTSFSGQFHVISKLVIIAMMLRGRHRGLPYALDRAILLPGDNVHKKDDENAAQSLRRRPSANSAVERSSTEGGEALDADAGGGASLSMARTATATRATGSGALQDPTGPADSAAVQRRMPRRTSEATRVPTNETASAAGGGGGGAGKRRHSRTRSLSLLVGGLSAGPTYSRPE